MGGRYDSRCYRHGERETLLYLCLIYSLSLASLRSRTFMNFHGKSTVFMFRLRCFGFLGLGLLVAEGCTHTYD